MARIMLLSDSINIPSGFGVQAKYISAGLSQAGHDVYALGIAHRGTPQEVNLVPNLFPQGKVTMIPNGGQRFGEDILGYWIGKIRPHILLTLLDLWMTNYIHELDLGSTRWVRYTPLDSEVMLNMWRPPLLSSDELVTFSTFANKLVEETVGIKVKNISHGVDTNTFRPLKKEEKIKAKINAGFHPDDFVVGFVGRNQLRKMQPYFFKAFAEFAKDKEDVKCLVHMDMRDEKLGWNLPNIFELLNIKHKIIKTTLVDGFHFKMDINEHKMNLLYNMMDLHYNSGNEGFGVPAMESNAAGTPGIMPDYTTSKELTNYGKCGYLTKVGEGIVHPIGAEWIVPDRKDLTKWLNYAYENRDDVKRLGERAREYAVKNYDWKVIMPKWVKYIKWLLKNPPKVNYLAKEFGV